jgi:hypothetical protein
LLNVWQELAQEDPRIPAAGTVPGLLVVLLYIEQMFMMMRILCLSLTLMAGAAYADESPVVVDPAAAAVTDQAVSDRAPTEQKSFFESWTVEDFQQLVTVDAKLLDAVNEPASQGAG